MAFHTGVMVGGMFEDSPENVPQGGPLSPLLGNVMLNECDWELERRGHRFVRYADDLMIFCKSKKAAVRTLDKILPFIEGKLFLCIAGFSAFLSFGSTFGSRENLNTP